MSSKTWVRCGEEGKKWRQGAKPVPTEVATVDIEKNYSCIILIQCLINDALNH